MKWAGADGRFMSVIPIAHLGWGGMGWGEALGMLVEMPLNHLYNIPLVLLS
jgi:hypothetical protein